MKNLRNLKFTLVIISMGLVSCDFSPDAMLGSRDRSEEWSQNSGWSVAQSGTWTDTEGTSVTVTEGSPTFYGSSWNMDYAKFDETFVSPKYEACSYDTMIRHSDFWYGSSVQNTKTFHYKLTRASVSEIGIISIWLEYAKSASPPVVSLKFDKCSGDATTMTADLKSQSDFQHGCRSGGSLDTASPVEFQCTIEKTYESLGAYLNEVGFIGTKYDLFSGLLPELDLKIFTEAQAVDGDKGFAFYRCGEKGYYSPIYTTEFAKIALLSELKVISGDLSKYPDDPSIATFEAATWQRTEQGVACTEKTSDEVTSIDGILMPRFLWYK